ncbi:MAG: ArsR/SmtB family transcription factor [Chitinophagales bacterium]|jgi:DNA-binding transcriptional ArsR family regulator
MIFDPIRLQKFRLMFLKLRAISGSSRYFILNIINNQELISVGKLVELTNMDQPIVSQHLAVLKKADLVFAKALKKERHYCINKSELDKLVFFCQRLRGENEEIAVELNNAYSRVLEAYKYFKFLLHPGRMSLIEIMNRRGLSSVNELAEISKQSQSIASQNLKVLKDLALLIKKEDGRRIIYSLNKERIDALYSLLKD